MARGHPDFLTWQGREAGGTQANVLQFEGGISAHGSAVSSTITVPANYEFSFNNITISCDDDAFIHRIYLTRVAGAFKLFYRDFVDGEIFDFPGFMLTAGQQVYLLIENHSGSYLTFRGTLSFTERRTTQ